MPMQPLSRNKPPVRIEMAQIDTMARRPEIAIPVAECIAQWAEIENTLGFVLAILLDTEARAGIAMFNSLRSSNAQIAALDAAAGVKLSPEQKEVFDAVMTLVRKSAKERNRLAHWCWGRSPDLPDALLLIDPEWKLGFSSDTIGRLPRGRPKLDRIFVVKPKDVTDILAHMISTRALAGRISGFVWKRNSPTKRAELLQLLSSEPSVSDALQQIRKSKKNSLNRSE